MAFAWRKPPIGTSPAKADELDGEELVLVYDRNPKGGGWWKPGRVSGRVAGEPIGQKCLVRYRARRTSWLTALFPESRVRRVVSPALAKAVEAALEPQP